MRKALRVSKVTVGEMAVYLDVDRKTIGNWLGGRSQPSRGNVISFALRTGVPFEWIELGIEAHDMEPDGPDTQGVSSSAWNIRFLPVRSGVICEDDVSSLVTAA